MLKYTRFQQLTRRNLFNLNEQMQQVLSGAMYNDLTPELNKARQDAVFLTNEYNASYGRPQAEQGGYLKRLFKSIGEQVHFEPNLRCEFGSNISISNYFFANFDCILLDCGGIEVGTMSSLVLVSVFTLPIMLLMPTSASMAAVMPSLLKSAAMYGLAQVCILIRVSPLGEQHHWLRKCCHERYSRECNRRRSSLPGTPLHYRSG